MTQLITQNHPETAVIGRIDPDNQEQIVDPSQLESRLQHLIDLHETLNEAKEAFSEAVKAAAEASGLLSSTVRSFVAARASENFSDRARKVAQLALVFDELGASPQHELIGTDEA